MDGPGFYENWKIARLKERLQASHSEYDFVLHWILGVGRVANPLVETTKIVVE